MAFIHSRVSEAEPDDCLRVAADAISVLWSNEDSLFFFFVLKCSDLNSYHCTAKGNE